MEILFSQYMLDPFKIVLLSRKIHASIYINSQLLSEDLIIIPIIFIIITF
jgi:hypothetical protein